MQDQFADLSRTGERHLINVWVSGNCGTRGFTIPGHDIDYARRKSGFFEEFPQAESCKRSLLGGFKHYSAAGRQRRSKFPCGHQKRKIPRDDLSDHSDWFAQRVSKIFLAKIAQRNRSTFDLR